MATLVVDDGGVVSVMNGVGDSTDAKTSEDTTMEVIEANEVNLEKAPVKSFPLRKAPGPPNLHPTVTTWQWLFSASDMNHTPSVLHSGMSLEQEKYLRWKGIQLIFRIAEYLKL